MCISFQNLFEHFITVFSVYGIYNGACTTDFQEMSSVHKFLLYVAVEKCKVLGGDQTQISRATAKCSTDWAKGKFPNLELVEMFTYHTIT